MPFSYASILSLSSTLRMHKTQTDSLVSSESATGKTLDVFYHCFFLTSSRPVTSESALETFSQLYHRKNGKPRGSVLSVTLFAVSIKAVVKAVVHLWEHLRIGQHRCLLQISEHCHQQAPAVLCCKLPTTEDFSPERKHCVRCTHLRGL
jgi:hypothetical protein